MGVELIIMLRMKELREMGLVKGVEGEAPHELDSSPEPSCEPGSEDLIHEIFETVRRYRLPFTP